MPLNLDNIGTIKFPQTKTLLECSNGVFTISDNGIIRFTYDRKPDLEKVREVEEELEQANKELTRLLDKPEDSDSLSIAQARANIKRLESLSSFLQQERVTAQYECWWIEDMDILNKWLELAKSSNKNSVWSVAYKTWLRFEDTENPNEDIDYTDQDIWDWVITYREWHYTWKKTNRETE